MKMRIFYNINWEDRCWESLRGIVQEKETETTDTVDMYINMKINLHGKIFWPLISNWMLQILRDIYGSGNNFQGDIIKASIGWCAMCLLIIILPWEYQVLTRNKCISFQFRVFLLKWFSDTTDKFGIEFPSEIPFFTRLGIYTWISKFE